MELLTPVAAHGSDKDLRETTEHLVAVALSDKEGEAKAKACHDSRRVHESSLADGSLRRFIITADAEGAAVIHAILNSPLAAPAPDETGPDPRTASQRRYDALMSVLGRGMSSPGAAPSTAKAKIFLTIPFTALALSLAGALAGTGAGCDHTGPCYPTSTGQARAGHPGAGQPGDGPIGAGGVDAGTAFTPPGASTSTTPTAPGAPTGAVPHIDDADAENSAAAGLFDPSSLGDLGGLSGPSDQGGLSGLSGPRDQSDQGGPDDLGGVVAPGLLLGGAGLLGGAAGVRWPAPGLGRTFTGEALTPGQVRRLACQADLIPVVLGTHSEVLDLGRESRLATPAQLRCLWLRDTTCTFPGCSVPNTWCDAHHVIWWSRHGNTDILNLALLCGRHHTIVHTKDLTATIDATSVTWHL